VATYCNLRPIPHVFRLQVTAHPTIWKSPSEGFIEGLLPHGFEELDYLTVTEDIEEAQEFPVDAAGCRQEGRKDFSDFGVSSAPTG